MNDRAELLIGGAEHLRAQPQSLTQLFQKQLRDAVNDPSGRFVIAAFFVAFEARRQITGLDESEAREKDRAMAIARAIETACRRFDGKHRAERLERTITREQAELFERAIAHVNCERPMGRWSSEQVASLRAEDTSSTVLDVLAQYSADTEHGLGMSGDCW